MEYSWTSGPDSFWARPLRSWGGRIWVRDCWRCRSLMNTWSPATKLILEVEELLLEPRFERRSQSSCVNSQIEICLRGILWHRAFCLWHAATLCKSWQIQTGHFCSTCFTCVLGWTVIVICSASVSLLGDELLFFSYWSIAFHCMA